MNADRKMFFDDLFDIFSMLIGENYVTLYDIKEQVTRYSPAIVEMLALPGEYIPDGVYDWMDYIHPEDRDKYENTMGEMLALRKLTYDLSYRVRLKNGEYNMFRLVGGVIRDMDGHPSIAGGMMIGSGLVERMDRTTSLPNLNAFFDDLIDDTMAGPTGQGVPAAMMERTRESAWERTLLLIGFGRLSHINEVYGYGHGSMLLKAMGEVIKEVVADVGRVYRMEGSKFAVLSAGASMEELAGVYEAVQKRFRHGISVDGVAHHLVSYGGALSVEAGQERRGRTLYDCLLQAYNESKQYRHGGLVVYNGNHVTDPSVSASITVINAIRESISSDFEGFYLKYQPVFDMKQMPVAAEAKLFWKNEQYQSVAPESFIPEIRQDYTFAKLGYWFFQKAMIDGKEFLMANPKFQLMVPIYPSQIEDPYFANNLEEIARKSNFPLPRLSIELTRECRLMDMERLGAFAEALHERGMQIGLDDFARGNAWLQTFMLIEPDHVRFSEELAKNLDKSKKVQTLLSYLIQMIHECDADVYVKGIGPKDRDFLAQLPIIGMQGNMLSQPIYFDEVLDYYDSEDSGDK